MLNINGDLDKVSQRREKREKRRRKRAIKITMLVIAGIVFLYFAAAVFVALWSNISTALAVGGSLQESVRVNGYVFKNQSVINAEWDGHFECLVSEGERVKQGQTIGYIYRVAPSREKIDRIKKLHKMILISEAFDKGVYMSGAEGAAEKKVSEMVRDLSDVRQNYNLKEALDKKEAIDIFISKKKTSSTDEQSDEIYSDTEKLLIELDSLEKEAGESLRVVAQTGGVYSSKIDGLEDSLAYDKANGLTPSQLSALDEKETMHTGEVLTGQPLCKIVDNYNWYYAVNVRDSIAEDFKIGQSVQMSFYDLANGLVKGTVKSISESENGKRTIVISSNRYVDGIYSTSHASADIVTVNVDGIKLPVGCLRVKDGVTGLYVIRLDRVTFVPVNVIYKNDEWVILSAAEPELGGAKLKIYDEVIIEGRNLEDGKVIR